MHHCLRESVTLQCSGIAKISSPKGEKPTFSAGVQKFLYSVRFQVQNLAILHHFRTARPRLEKKKDMSEHDLVVSQAKKNNCELVSDQEITGCNQTGVVLSSSRIKAPVKVTVKVTASCGNKGRKSTFFDG